MMVVRSKLLWVALYAIAMAAVESAVVVYLRALHPGDAPLTVLLHEIPDRLIAIEVAREAATLVMILAVTTLAGQSRWERFLYFCLAFGTWDIFYYVWLWVFIGWPPSLLTWDVLFLIPVPWLGPVIAPVIVSICLVGASIWLLGQRETPILSPLVWSFVLLGGSVVLLSFMIDYRYALARMDPPRFRWEIFGTGVGIAIAALLGHRLRSMTGVPPLPKSLPRAERGGEGDRG
jgi:hypothetical protein